MGRYAVPIGEALHEYVVSRGTPPDEVMQDLIAETRQVHPDRSGMQIAPEQSALMYLLARIIGVRDAVEIGTFTGMSSLAVARGMVPEGKLVCLDASEEYTQIARRYWERAGVSERVELRIGDARELVRALPNEVYLDMAFIDADKPSYMDYWEQLVPRMRPGGLVMVDNTLWSGEVADPTVDSERVEQIRAFNDHVHADKRVEVVILPISDGLTLAMKR